MPHGSAYRPVSHQNHQTLYDAVRLASAARGRKSRPVSWHPASAGRISYPTPYLNPSAGEHPSTVGFGSQPLNTTPSYMDGGMISYPMDLLVSNDSFAPSFDVQDSAPMQQPSMMQMDDSQGSREFDIGASSTAPMPPPMPDTWPLDMMPMDDKVSSADLVVSNEIVPSPAGLNAPLTPDFLLIQNPEPDSVADNQESEDELVGMGLYNTPGALENSRLGLSGKGLKLEETFTPSSDNEGDNTPSDDDQEPLAENDALSQQSAICKQPAKSSVDLLRKPFFFDDDLDPYGVDDPQQLINWGDQPCMNYGYGWI